MIVILTYLKGCQAEDGPGLFLQLKRTGPEVMDSSYNKCDFDETF